MPPKRDPEHQDATSSTAETSGASDFHIFLSYRREDASGHAGRLFDFLRHRGGEGPGYGKDQIFMDVDTVAPGADFRRVIDEAVGSCDVFIAVIGRQWLTVVDAKGQRRLDDPADFVRLEVESAIRRDIPVVPALVQGAQMPGVDDVPETLQEFVHRNAVELSDARWSFDVGRLVDWLETVQEEKARREQAERERQKREEAAKAEAAERGERERLKRERAEAAERKAAERAERQHPEKAEEHARVQPAQAVPKGTESDKMVRNLAARSRRFRIPIAIAVVLGIVGVIVVLAVVRSGGGGGGQTPDEDEPFPTVAEQQVLNAVPAGLTDTCFRTGATDYHGASAEVSCVAPKVGNVVYRLALDTEKEADYLFGGSCSSGEPTTWKHGEICEANDSLGSSLYWIDSRYGVSGSVTHASVTPESLREEWDCCLRYLTTKDLAEELRS